jgi:undecaprenyl diphosphate synthase
MDDAAGELERLRAEVRAKPVPGHVAIIMDGNGRWAEARGLPRLSGHREGARAVRAVTREARRLGVKFLTLYAFSSQNWQRPQDEVRGLMALLADYLATEREEILGNGIKLDAIGDLGKLPTLVRIPLEALRMASAGNTGMQLTLALSYGGREELVQAAKALAEDAAAGKIKPSEITEQSLRDRMWTAAMPDPDLVIRTSGELRVSNFLLFQLAYSELKLTDLAWPDFRERALLEAIGEFQNRERRYGLTSAQLREGSGR